MLQHLFLFLHIKVLDFDDSYVSLMADDGSTREDLKVSDKDLCHDIVKKLEHGEDVVVRLSCHLQTSLNMLKNLYWGFKSIFSVIYAHDRRGSKICKFGGHVCDLCGCWSSNVPFSFSAYCCEGNGY